MRTNETRLKDKGRKFGLSLAFLLMLVLLLSACGNNNSSNSSGDFAPGVNTGGNNNTGSTNDNNGNNNYNNSGSNNNSSSNTGSYSNSGGGGGLVNPSQGNHQLFVEPDDGVAPEVNGINAAKTNVDMVMYLLTDRDVISALISAQKRGVQVRVMLEQHPYGEGAGNGSAYNQLQQAGVQVKWTNPVFALTHEKAIVLDNKIALIMTLNSTLSAFTKNREYGVLTYNPNEAQEVEAGFQADWNRTNFTPPANSPLIWSNSNSRQKILAFIDSAQHTLVMEQEEMQDREVEQHLVQAAQRGVKIRVLVAAPSGGSDSNASGEQQLVSGGVQVETISSPYMHAKMYLADGNRVILCSENVSTASLNNNRELGIEVSDQAIVSRVSQTFEQDWSKGQTFR